ncbi:hypothetical protein DFH09DRAFT_980979 [Mycena vulgaris]|nr:hypothetical protein DFH09DRAFT_980979 [Mycena vulgaris]
MPDSLDIRSLSSKLASLSTEDEKVSAILSHLTQCTPSTASGHDVLLPHGLNAAALPQRTPPADSDSLSALCEKHGLHEPIMRALQTGQFADGSGAATMFGFQDHVLDHIPCAYTIPEKPWSCLNPTKSLRCGACQLVVYCSKDCQQKHWKTHKSDCKDPIRSKEWQPRWVLEQRSPSFMSDKEEPKKPWAESLERISVGSSLWGNMPAVDIINLPRNEADLTKDLALVFAASGDLRNVLYTVNQLPLNYKGELTIVINDHDPYVALRNALILHVLRKMPDARRACDLALHLWYSAYYPPDYEAQVNSFGAEFLHSHGDPRVGDGWVDTSLPESTSTFAGRLSLVALERFAALINPANACTRGDISNEIHRVRFAENRVDRYHREYCRLEPSHRLSSLEFRRFVLLLPFGAPNNYFSTPNRFLFSPAGKWMQGDMANPLDSWDPVAVVDAGKKHGVPRSDLYGCLYFYLTGLLRSFVDRLSHLRIAFKVFNMDASDLARSMKSGALSHFGIPATLRFDRVDVSNIVDHNYVGIVPVLQTWGPMLKHTPHATLLGYFMNWAGDNEGARPGKDDMSHILNQLIKEGKLPIFKKNMSAQEYTEFEAKFPAYFNSFTALYDNSRAFEEHLKDQGLTGALQERKLKRKAKHTIMPHRLYVPLDAPPTALPVFPDAETWYLRANIGQPQWSERYVEFSPA